MARCWRPPSQVWRLCAPAATLRPQAARSATRWCSPRSGSSPAARCSWRSGGSRAGAAVAAALALVAASLGSLQNFNTILPPREAYPGPAPSIAVLQRQPGPFHVGVIRRPGERSVLNPNSAALYGLEGIEGYDFPLSRRWSDLQGKVLRFPALRAETAKAVMPPAGPVLTALRMLNTRYYLAPPGQPRPAPGFRVVHAGPDATVLRDDAALPRAYVVPAAARTPYGQALDLLARGAVDPRRTALVPPGAPVPSRPGALRGWSRSAQADRLAPDHLRIHVGPGPPGWLVIADAYAPSWTAAVTADPGGCGRPTWR